VESYTILDIPDALALQRKFLEARGIKNVRFLDELPDETFDVGISSCALSELDEGTAGEIAERVFTGCQSGYVVWSIPTDMRRYFALSQEAANEWMQARIGKPIRRVRDELYTVPEDPCLPGVFWR